MAGTIHVDVVSAEESIFSGEAKFVALPVCAAQATFVAFSKASSMVPTM